MKPQTIKPHIEPKETKFNPNRAYIDQAVKAFLKKGGKIQRIQILPEMSDWSDRWDVDKFLMGD